MKLIDQWTLALSIIAIILSLINFIYLYCTNKKKLDINIRNYTTSQYPPTKDKENPFFYMIYIDFINKSRLPIAITSVQIIDSENIYNINLSSERIAEKNRKQNNVIIERQTVDSAGFPINLNGLTAKGEILLMYGKKEFSNEKSILIINTNRGKVKKKINIKQKVISNANFTEQYML